MTASIEIHILSYFSGHMSQYGDLNVMEYLLKEASNRS